MAAFATVQDVRELWRELTPEESHRAEALLGAVSDILRIEAARVGKDLDAMAKESEAYRNVLTSVTVDIVARSLMTSTNQEPMVQVSQSALGYSQSGTYLVPGGGIYAKNAELARLGLRRQRFGTLEFYDTRDHGDTYH